MKILWLHKVDDDVGDDDDDVFVNNISKLCVWRGRGRWTGTGRRIVTLRIQNTKCN